MPLTPGTYTPPANTKIQPGTATFMDIVVSPATLNSGELFRRFDTKAYPQLGKTLTGTDSQGNPQPKPAVICADKPH